MNPLQLDGSAIILSGGDQTGGDLAGRLHYGTWFMGLIYKNWELGQETRAEILTAEIVGRSHNSTNRKYKRQ